MKICIDTHTHSVVSGHAYSTIDDLARGARKRGLKGFVLTDHGPAMPGGPHSYHFSNLRILPAKIQGVLFFRGAETNIMNDQGGLDLGLVYCKRLDFVMAGFHEVCFGSQGREKNTHALIAALANPLVDGISHPGNPAFPIDIEAVVKAAAQYGKTLEINNSSFRIRPGSEENCRLVASLSVQYGSLLSCGSDAHYWEDVGNFAKAKALLEDVGVPPELVINSSLERFRAFVEKRRAERGELSAG
ncbi:putative hydrolase [Treponema primitia ZAS-2]|uniref:Putative hydrolase n=1 Tax=Treponema primitia (strain ATCC BAA-887 / DSM 12427 / ZAS-2) TaxID=545694 RepID=F5YK44_TREPZ|nr:phosphatase [Treponema primitia]AEF86894.1 putative hydrolase [Treponema primitia ZAS-2]